MRINVYQEELVGDPLKAVALVSKEANGVRYHGLRLFLEGSGRLHNTTDDDDRPAITLWFSGPLEAAVIADTLRRLAAYADKFEWVSGPGPGR